MATSAKPLDGNSGAVEVVVVPDPVVAGVVVTVVDVEVVEEAVVEYENEVTAEAVPPFPPQVAFTE